jgi:predicted RND superfamily exporter protein
MEKALRAWGYFVIRHRWVTLLSSLLVTALFVSALPRLSIDNSVEGEFHPDDPDLARYNDFRDRFDRDDRIILGLTPRQVFSFEFLDKLRAFHRELEDEVPYVEEITSLINARSTRGEGDRLIVGELMEEWPEDRAALEALKKRVLENPFYANTLISSDAALTVVSIKPFTYSTFSGSETAEELEGFDESDGSPGADLRDPEFLTKSEVEELLSAVRTVIARYETPDFPIYLAGEVAISHSVDAAMERDMQIFMMCALAAMCILLAVLFRRVTGVLAPLLVVQLSLLATIGIMVMLEIPASISIEVLPVFVSTVGICDAVHILTIVYQRLAVGSSKQDAIAFAMGHSALPVVMTSLTTAAGMMSFTTAELAPVAHLGIMAPIGIMLALVYTVVLLPSLLAILPLKAAPASGSGVAGGSYSRFLAGVADFAACNPRSILAVTLVVVLVSVVGLARVRFAHNGLTWFPEDDPLRVAHEVIDRGLNGAAALEVLIDTGRENGLHDPETLTRIEAAMRHAESFEASQVSVGKAQSIVDIVEETHQALNENRPAYRTIPRDGRLVAQELLLFENSGSDDIQPLVDTTFRTARMTVRVSTVDAMQYREFLKQLEPRLAAILGKDIEFEMTGLVTLFSGVVERLLTSMTRSYVFALLVITPLMILLLGSLRLGLISMIPNLIPIVFTLGMMGWLGVPLDATTILIGAVVMGLAVDDTIHFMHKFQRYYEATGDARQAIHETLTSTGAAMLFTTLVLCGCFFTFTLAYLSNIARFGLLGGMAIMVAFLADVLLAPALMVLADRRRARRATASPARVGPCTAAATSPNGQVGVALAAGMGFQQTSGRDISAGFQPEK